MLSVGVSVMGNKGLSVKIVVFTSRETEKNKPFKIDLSGLRNG
jgi:hypothetical protein